MKLHSTLAGAVALLLLLAAHAPPSMAAEKSCAMIRGSGIGVTEGIARWMANKAVADSAAKWSGNARHKLSPVKITCSGFGCSGAARACRH